MMFLRALILSAATLAWVVLALIFGATLLGQVTAITTKSWSVFMLLPSLATGLLALFFWRLAHKHRSPREAHKASPQTTAPEEFNSRVVGTTFTNPDGSDRQTAIQKYCKPGTQLQLAREPNNSHDPGAIAVHCGGVQIGYLSSELANEYAADIDAGRTGLRARVKEVTGGQKGKQSLGVNIIVTIHDFDNYGESRLI